MPETSTVAIRPRLLIFVIAYHAESTMKWVLERIPSSVFHDFDCHVLVVDDASTDRTYEISQAYQAAHPEVPMTVLRNAYNQGYGGNQKVGYSFAIRESFDFVAMVHGDGQYAPEELPNLVRPIVENEADAVFGSRMLVRFGALKGGMPFYKYLGNKILTTAQNTLLGSRLSEFHSGYRLYRVSTLKRLPFLLNSNDFHFDTEIIIQLLNSSSRIKELPIPTYYGDEICRVNGMKYAKDVMLATTKNALHRSGLLYQRRFDTEAADNTHYDLKLGYASSHTYALNAVPAQSRVLDIGAGPGGMAQELVKKGCTVTVVDQHPSQTADPNVTVKVQDLNQPLDISLKDTEQILMLDIIEHLQDPELFLERLRAKLDFTPRTLILTTPNVAFVVQRLMLAFGQFNYGKAGILDRTHTRLFTFRSLRQLLDDAGMRVVELKGVPAPFPKVFGDGALGRAAVFVNQALIDVAPTLFSYQIFVRAETRPGVDFVLKQAQEEAEPR